MPYKPTRSGKPRKPRAARADRLVRLCHCGRFIIFLSDPVDPHIKKPCLLADEEGRLIWNGNPCYTKGRDRIHIDAAYRREPCVETLIL